MPQDYCYLNLTKQICATASQKMTVKAALLNVGFSQEEINNNNKHRHAVGRAKRRLSLHVTGSLPSLVDIAQTGVLSAITNTDTAIGTTTTAMTKEKKEKINTMNIFSSHFR